MARDSIGQELVFHLYPLPSTPWSHRSSQGSGIVKKYLELPSNVSQNLSLRVPPVSNLVTCMLQDIYGQPLFSLTQSSRPKACS